MNTNQIEYKESIIKQQLSERKNFDRGYIYLDGRKVYGVITRIVDTACIFVTDNGTIAVDLSDVQTEDNKCRTIRENLIGY